MRTVPVVLDASGSAVLSGGGIGFRLKRARVGADSVSAVRPGEFPLVVEGVQKYRVTSAAPVWLSEGERFELLRLSGGQSGTAYEVELYGERGEGSLPSPKVETRASSYVVAGTAVSTLSPTGNDGFAVRPGMRAWTAYASSGVACELWVRSAAGNWKYTGETLDFAVRPVESRQVLATADRVALKAASGGMTYEVDVECEVD